MNSKEILPWKNNMTYIPPWSNIEVQDISDNAPKSMYWKMVGFVTKSEQFKSFTSNINIAEWIWPWYYLLECPNHLVGDNTINEFKNNFLFEDNKFNSIPIDENKQIPEYVGSFSYDEKFYLIVFSHNSLTKENNIDKGIYKWMILDPILYFWEWDNWESDINSKVNDLL